MKKQISQRVFFKFLPRFTPWGFRTNLVKKFNRFQTTRLILNHQDLKHCPRVSSSGMSSQDPRTDILEFTSNFMLFRWHLVCFKILYHFQRQGDPLGVHSGLKTNYMVYINYQLLYLKTDFRSLCDVGQGLPHIIGDSQDPKTVFFN